jgi:hypothetical protein
MFRHVVATIALSTAWVLPAAAVEFVPSWDTDLIWDSNVFRTDTDEESDFQIRTGPDARLRDQKGDVTYDFYYQLRFEDYFRLNGVRDFDHFLNARGAWQMTANTRFSAYDNFAYTSNLGSLLEFAGTGPNEIGVITPQRERVTINNASTELSHRLSPRWSLVTSMSHGLVEYEETDQTDSTNFSGVGQLLYGVSQRLTAGFGVQAQRQEFDAVNQAQEGTGSTFFQGFGVVEYRFSPTFTISANAGPAWSKADDVEDQGFTTVSYATLAVPGGVVAVNPDTCPIVDGQPALLLGCSTAIYRDQATGGEVFQGLIPDGLGNFEVAFVSPEYCQDNPLLCLGVVGVSPGANGVPLQSARVVPVDSQDNEGTLTYFARIRAEKKWRHWRAELGYQRSASSGSGVGVSTALDLFSGTLEWTPTRNWFVTLNASYSTQSSFGDQQVPFAFAVEADTDIAPDFTYEFEDDPGTPRTAVAEPLAVPTSLLTTTTDSAIDIVTIRGTLRAQRRFGENLFVDATATYWRQKNQGDFQQERERQIITIGVGVTWRFDPIVL